MASPLDSGQGRPCSSLNWAHSVVVLGQDTLFLHCLSHVPTRSHGLLYRRIQCWGSHAIVAYRAHAFSLSPSFIARKKKPSLVQKRCYTGYQCREEILLVALYTSTSTSSRLIQVQSILSRMPISDWLRYSLFCEEDLDKVLNDQQIYIKTIRLFPLDFYA